MTVLHMDSLGWHAAGSDFNNRYASVGNPTNLAPQTASPPFTGARYIKSVNDTSWSLTTQPFTSSQTIFMSLRIRRDADPGWTETTSYIALHDATVTHLYVDFRMRDGSVKIYRGTLGGTLLGSLPAGSMIVGEWHSYQFKFVIDDTAGVVQIRKNGSASYLLNLTGLDTRNGGTAAVIRCSLVADGANLIRTAYSVRDWIIGNDQGSVNNDWFRDVRIDPLYVNAAGDVATWSTTVGGASNYQGVDEFPHDSDTSYIESNTIGQKFRGAITSIGAVTAPTTIYSAQMLGIVRKTDAGFREFALNAISGATEVTVSNTSTLGTTYVAHMGPLWELNFNGSVAWTSSAINSLKIGGEVVS